MHLCVCMCACLYACMHIYVRLYVNMISYHTISGTCVWACTCSRCSSRADNLKINHMSRRLSPVVAKRLNCRHDFMRDVCLCASSSMVVFPIGWFKSVFTCMPVFLYMQLLVHVQACAGLCRRVQTCQHICICVSSTACAFVRLHVVSGLARRLWPAGLARETSRPRGSRCSATSPRRRGACRTTSRG